MNKQSFLQLLGRAYTFPDYYAANLDSAEEIIEDLKEEQGRERLSLAPLFHALLEEASPAERAKIWALVADHFEVS